MGTLRRNIDAPSQARTGSSIYQHLKQLHRSVILSSRTVIIIFIQIRMIPFYNFEMPPNPYNLVYPSLPILNLVNPVFQPQYYPPQQMVCVGYLPQAGNFQTGPGSFSHSNSTFQSRSSYETASSKGNQGKFQFLKQTKCRQNNQQFEVSVPKSRFNKKTAKVKYLKKNTESNVSNQVLTFLADEKKSKDFLIRLCQKSSLDEKEVICKFYEWMNVIKASTKKYISKKILLKLSLPSADHLLVKEFSKININLSESELNSFCKIVRILMRLFLTEFSHLTVLTSKKIHREGAVEHLVRRRQIKNYLEQKHMKI